MAGVSLTMGIVFSPKLLVVKTGRDTEVPLLASLLVDVKLWTLCTRICEGVWGLLHQTRMAQTQTALDNQDGCKRVRYVLLSVFNRVPELRKKRLACKKAVRSQVNELTPSIEFSQTIKVVARHSAVLDMDGHVGTVCKFVDKLAGCFNCAMEFSPFLCIRNNKQSHFG
jgi:hypothetical protein